MRNSSQLLETGFNLPYQSSSTSYYSVCMILISSNVVNERQNKFYSGLYQHDIRYNRKRRSDEAVPPLAGLHPVSEFPNTLPPIRQASGWRISCIQLYRTRTILPQIKMSFFMPTEEADIPLITSRKPEKEQMEPFLQAHDIKRGKGQIFAQSITETSAERENVISQSFNSTALELCLCSTAATQGWCRCDRHQQPCWIPPLQGSRKVRQSSRGRGRGKKWKRLYLLPKLLSS